METLFSVIYCVQKKFDENKTQPTPLCCATVVATGSLSRGHGHRWRDRYEKSERSLCHFFHAPRWDFSKVTGWISQRKTHDWWLIWLIDFGKNLKTPQFPFIWKLRTACLMSTAKQFLFCVSNFNSQAGKLFPDKTCGFTWSDPTQWQV